MSEEREKVYEILELGKHLKNLHHKKGFGGLLFIDLSMIKFSKLSTYIRKLDKENKELKEDISFCLHSIKQEMEMSTDSRTRNEMTSCYEILKRGINE